MSSGSSTSPQVYYVPWKAREAKDPPAAGLVLYWFPLTNDELKRSSLRESRTLSLYSSQCVSMELADFHTPEGAKLVGDSKPPVAVLATPEGSPLAKAENAGGILKVAQVEKLVESEVKQRESARDSRRLDFFSSSLERGNQYRTSPAAGGSFGSRSFQGT